MQSFLYRIFQKKSKEVEIWVNAQLRGMRNNIYKLGSIMVESFKMKNIEGLRAKFLRAYANLPAPEKSQVIAIIDGRTYSWDIAYVEISNITKLGDMILEKLSLLEIL